MYVATNDAAAVVVALEIYSSNSKLVHKFQKLIGNVVEPNPNHMPIANTNTNPSPTANSNLMLTLTLI